MATRDDQTDTCHGSCEGDCRICSSKVQIDFRPRDIRGDFFGIPDPKLQGAGGSNEVGPEH